MKYILVIVCMFFETMAEGQVFTITIDTIYTFRHPKEIETNEAIVSNNIRLSGAFDVKMVFMLDIQRRILSRMIDSNTPVKMPIVYLHEINGCYNIIAEYKDKKSRKIEYPNYTFAKLPGGNYMIELRVLQNEEIHGWFNDAARVKIEY